jgi:hypothetical protein
VHSAREAAALTLIAAVPAVVGGLLYQVIAGGTTVSRAVATGFWIAAFVYLVLWLFTSPRALWRRTPRPLPEGSVFVTAAIVLTAIGAILDAV